MTGINFRMALLVLTLSVSFAGSLSRPQAASPPRTAQVQSPEAASASGPTLTYNSGSSAKVQQIIGDCDWAVQAANGTCKQTASRTISNANIAGTDVGPSFEQPSTGRLIFMFGDTISNDPSAPWSANSLPKVDYHQHDPIAWTTSTDGDAPLALTFFLSSPQGAPVPTPFFVEPQFLDGTKVDMGGDDVPHAGIEFNGKTYVMINTGANFSLIDPHQNYFSVLASWDGTNNANAFTALRPYSMLPNGHFIVTSLHELTPMQAGGSETMQGILTYGIGGYKLSQIYLSFTLETPSPVFAGAPGFEDGLATKYFTGLTSGQPTWSNNESDALPVVSDVVQGPTIDHMSVAYSQDLGLWLMTFGGGRTNQGDGTPTNGTPATDGVYFTYAPAPWGPWARPQLIFNAIRDSGFGVFMHNQTYNPPGPLGPTAGTNDPNTTTGTIYAPNMIGRFTKASGNTLTIYYTMSTWNPYTVVEMRSQFTITQPSDFSLAFAQPTIMTSGGKVPVTLNINRTGGFTGSVTVSPPASTPKGIIPLLGSIPTTGNSVSFKIKVKGSAQPGSYPLIFTGSDDSGRQREATLTLVVQ